MRWLRFIHQGLPAFGYLEADQIRLCRGDMFDSPSPGEQMLPLAGLQLLPPLPTHQDAGPLEQF